MDGKISNLMQVASLRRYVITDGRSNGIEVIDCDTGKIRFMLNVTKGLDIMQLFHEGQNVSFLSKNAFIAQESPFLRRFEGGMLYTCGLDSVGGVPGHELHGSYHNTIADVIRAECNGEQITVEAIMRDTELFGKNLVLKRKVTAKVGGQTVFVDDVLVNEGYRDEEFCLLYHVNLGYPMLDAGCEIEVDAAEIVPRNEWAEQNAAEAFKITEPEPCREETCYYLSLKQNRASLVNKKAGKRFTLEYAGECLKHFIEWKSMACGDYALGLEPSTTRLDEGFTFTTLPAKQSTSFSLALTVEKF